jgi:hypothetical protein
VGTQGADSLAAIRLAVMTALNLHNAWAVNGKFSIRKSKLFQAAQFLYNGSPDNVGWEQWIQIDIEGQLFFHNDMPTRILVRSIDDGLVLWTIHTGGVVQVIKSTKIENRVFVLVHVEYDGENV